MGKRSRRSTVDEEWDPAATSRPKTNKRPTLKDLSSDSDSSVVTKASSLTPAPRKGGRTRVACDQCSKRRSRCSLEGPACEGCVERGDPESCSYQSLIWIDNVEDLPSRQLRRKLDALEALLQSLPKPTVISPSPPRRSPIQLPVQLPPASPPPEFANNSVSTSLASARDSLARSLFVNGTLNRTILPEGINIDELDFDVSLTRFIGFPGLVLALILSLYQLRTIDNNFLLTTARLPPATPTTLPSPPQAHLAICFFSSTINPTFRLVYEPIFFRQCQDFWASGMVPSPAWLALYLAVCSSGFKVILGDKEATLQSGLLEDEIAQLAEKCWSEARDTLELEGFPLSSSVESIQVAVTLALSSLYGDSSNISRASSLLSLAAAAALDLGLGVDPREGLANATPLDVEMRRRTFWALYACEAMFDLIIGKAPSELCTANPSVRRPLFLSNDCFLVSGHLSPIGVDATTKPIIISPTSSLFTVSALAVKASRVSKARGGETELVRLLEELNSFDGAFRSSPTADAMFRAAFVRLHQASKELNLSNGDRDAVAAKHLDALSRSAVALTSTMAPDLLFLSTALALSSAVRSCVVLYDGQTAFERNRPDLRNFALALSSSFRSNSLRLPASRCASIIQHIVDEYRRPSCEATPSLIGSSLATPNSENTLPSPAASAPISALEPPTPPEPSPSD
ncbi:hypothetical protein JCM11491_007071 [Sporobolomyces phaffii]